MACWPRLEPIDRHTPMQVTKAGIDQGNVEARNPRSATAGLSSHYLAGSVQIGVRE